MANPIIKIKRGTGKPQVWNGTTGITAGEFAFDTNTGILYIGMLGAGGYTGHLTNVPVGSYYSSTDPNVIPIGYQLSNDITFGGIEVSLNQFLGYNQFTVPSTYAVREFVKTSVIAAAAGVEFNGGTGIQVITTGNAGTTYTIVNTGVLKGFTSAGVAGNAFGDRLYAKSANDGITFVGGGGIALRSSNANGYIEIQNYGVTSINGFTGDIKTFAPISSLAGFSQDVGILLRTAITAVHPLKARDNDSVGYTGIYLEHAPLTTSANHLAYVNNVPQILGISWDNYGHVAGYVNRPLDFRTSSNGGTDQSGLPLGFTEATQDAAYSGITNNSGPNNYGIDYVYDDANGLLKTFNRGITSLSIVGGLGLSGAVNIAGGNGIVMTQNSSLNRVIVNYAGTQYQSFSAERPSVYGYTDNTAGGIYVGGITGPGINQRVVADSTQENLAVIAGRGIGISMGVLQTSDTMMLWNTGINTITAYNSASNMLGDSGYSGNMAIRAGTNIQLTRNANDLTISSTSGGGGGAISAIGAMYDTAIPPVTASGSGVTGNVRILGLNGVITRQETGANTINGDLYIGLSSKVKIPADGIPSDLQPDPYQTLEIATRRENSGSPNLPIVDGSYYQSPVEYSKLITDIVEGGFTAALTYGGAYARFSPQLDGEAGSGNVFNAEKSYPGRILSLRAREGIWKVGDGPASVIAGTHAELRLLGYPNPENMSAYIQGVFDFPSPANDTGCPSNNCYGMPPILPSCNTGLVDQQQVYYHTDGTGLRNNDSAATGQQRGTAVFHSNIVAQDSIFVQKDIWLTGELIDATTGCLYGVSGGGGSNVFNGGNLGLTGDLVVQGSIYVLGGTAFFHVKDLATESPLVKIGGMSGGTFSYTGILTANQLGYQGDRGLLLSTYHANPYSPLTNATASNTTFRQNFVGIDVSEGVFKYVTEAVFSENNGTNVLTSGSLGPVKFSEINNVGITSNNTTISLRTGSAGTPSTDIELNGYATIVGPLNTSANRASITLGIKTKARFGTAQDVGITFNRSIEFDSTANNSNNDFAANSLRIKYLGGSEGGRTDAHRTISIRAPISDGYTQLVDIGISTTSDSITGYTGSGQPLARQTIYNKTLGDGTIIDCGTY
jgi:hypothetical protein